MPASASASLTALREPSSRWTCNLALLVTLSVLWLCSLPTLSTASADVVFVLDGKHVLNNHSVTRCEGEDLLIGCGYRETVHPSDLSLRNISVTPPKKLRLTVQTQTELFQVRSYNLLARLATGDSQYQCVWSNIQYNVTIHFTASCTSPTDTPTTEEPTTHTPSTETPSTEEPTGSNTEPNTGTTAGTTGGGTTSSETTFKGLKPLIYTVASVILLGTLAIVAIITCWIRARRSFHNRIIRPNNTPQDYLDYISDNEFTPLTTSEFMASLHERPPTYNQSEEMTQQSDEAGNTNAQDRSTTETGGDSAVQSGGTQTAPTTNEGTLVEQRRQRGPGRERQRRRRRVVIVENGEGQSGESSVTLASVSPGQVVVTQEEDPSQGQGVTGDHPAQPQAANPGGGDSTAGGNNVTVLVNLQLPSLVTAEPSAQPGSSPDVPTQQEIDAIEARVNMLEVLSSPPFNSHRTSPSASAPSTSAADSVETAENNLIDFSSSPPPSTLPTSLDLDSL